MSNHHNIPDDQAIQVAIANAAYAADPDRYDQGLPAGFTPTTQPTGPAITVDLIPVSMLNIDDTILDIDGAPVHVSAITWGDDQYVRVEGVRLTDFERYDQAIQIEGGHVERALTAEELSAAKASKMEADDQPVRLWAQTGPRMASLPTPGDVYFLPEEEVERCAAADDGCDKPAEWYISTIDEDPRGLCSLHMHAVFAYWLTQPEVDEIHVERVR